MLWARAGVALDFARVLEMGGGLFLNFGVRANAEPNHGPYMLMHGTCMRRKDQYQGRPPAAGSGERGRTAIIVMQKL